MSFFGEKLDNIILEAKNFAIDLKFKSRIDDSVIDLNKVISTAMDSVVNARGGNTAPTGDDSSDHFTQPTLDSNIEELDAFSTEDENEPDFSKIDVDDLISESYIHGKSNEQIANEFVDDLQSVVEHYAWLFVALGAKMQEHRDAEVIQLLEAKVNRLRKGS